MSTSSSLYNQNRKEKFLDQLESATTYKDALSTFNKASPYEYANQKDLCEFTDEEAQKFVDEVLPPKVSSKTTQIYILQRYCKWCVGNQFHNAQNAFKNLRMLDVDAYKRRYVASPAHLQRCMDVIFDAEDQNTIDNTRRAFLWLAFLGVRSRHAALNLRCSDVDLQLMRVYSPYGVHKIYPEAIHALRNCATLKEFTHFHGGLYVNQMEREAGDKLLRGVARANLNLQTMRTSVNRANKKAEAAGAEPLSFLDLWKSGLFYRMYEQETAGWTVSFIKAAEEDKQRFNEDKNEMDVPAKVTNRDITRIRDEYTCWKMAFHG